MAGSRWKASVSFIVRKLSDVNMTFSARPTAPRFTLSDAERAYDDWGCNCGPAALAAICGMTLVPVYTNAPAIP